MIFRPIWFIVGGWHAHSSWVTGPESRESRRPSFRLEQDRLNRERLGLIERQRTIREEAQHQIDTLQKQVGEIGIAVSALTGSERDSDGIASLSIAFSALMSTVGVIQNIANREKLPTVTLQAGTVYQDGADTGVSLSVYSEGPDAENLSKLKTVVEKMTQSTGTLSGAITKDLPDLVP